MRRWLVPVLLVAVAGGVVWWQQTDRPQPQLAGPTGTPAASSPWPSASPSPAEPSPLPTSRPIESLEETEGLVAIGRDPGIVLVDAGAGEQRYELPVPGYPHSVRWSPSGRAFAYRVGRPIGDTYRAAVLSEGRDVLLVSADSFVAGPVWANEERLLAATEEAVVEIRTDGSESRRVHARDLGVCDDGGCPALSGLTVSADGAVGVSTSGGHVVLLPRGIGSEAEVSRNPRGSRCFDPHFRPMGARVGLTCYVPDRTPSPSTGRDLNAWVVVLDEKRWVHVRKTTVCYECGGGFFPWSPDGSEYVVSTFTEAPCGEGFYLVATTGRRVSEDVESGFGSFSPDGDRLVYGGLPAHCSSSGIYVGGVSLTDPERISTIGHGPRWSPAGVSASPQDWIRNETVNSVGRGRWPS